MFREVDGLVYGVLNDFDLAVSLDGQKKGVENDSIRRGRTGTRPFMAIELLESSSNVPNGLIHYPRYDWESIIWVVIWIVSRYHDGIDVTDLHNRWNMNDHTSSTEKTTYLWKVVDATFTGNFKQVRKAWAEPLCELIQRSKWAIYGSKKEPMKAFDLETAGGVFTWESFWHILEK